jgi:type 1 glutamine amidotransferase
MKKQRRLAWLIPFSILTLAPGVVAASEPAPPKPPPRRDVEAVLRLPEKPGDGPQSVAPTRKLRIVLVADKKDHGPDEHDYPRWQERWALLLGGKAASAASQINLFGPAIQEEKPFTGAENVDVLRADGFPSEAQLEIADVVVAFCYLPWDASRKTRLQLYLDRGGGLVLIHSATWTMPKADPEVARLVGVGGFTAYRHGPIQVEITAAGHPICRGLPRQLRFVDESYWPPTPPIDPQRVTVLAVSSEQDPASGQPSAQPIFWIAQPGRGRVFGCVLGHYTWTFDDPWFRILLLRGIAWSAGQPTDRFNPLVLQGARVAGD